MNNKTKRGIKEGCLVGAFGVTEAGTWNEVKDLLAAGARQVTMQQLDCELGALGYKINYRDSFTYDNTANKNKYRARHIAIEDIASGLSFAHVECRNPNRARLQELRRSTFVLNGWTIWEL